MDYCIKLDCYSGPLDLLLYLVRRQEVDIVELSISSITGQFLEFLEVIEILDLDLLGEFVVMASTLVEIKSRLVLPQQEEVEQLVEPAGDPRADLVKQLLDYKRFKEASRLLGDQASEWQLRFPRLSDDSPREGNDPRQDRIKEVELWDLVSALSRVLRRNTVAQPTAIIYDDTPIAVYIERIRVRVLEEQRVPFSVFFEGTNQRSKIVGIFLAILELLRHYGFRAEQPEDYAEIWVLPPLHSEDYTLVPDTELPGAP
jgi:segregation and condensation protein A